MGTLLLVHAHPDDEAIMTGGVMIRAKQDGHRVVLVTATRGEVGEISNMDETEVRPRLAEVRTEELRRAGEILGVDRQAFLGYRDSGMAGTADNQNPASFHLAPTAEAAGRLAEIMREERPDVVVTYTADGTYGHPDHKKAHVVTVAAVDVLEQEGWTPAKVYFQAIPQEMMRRWREQAREQAERGGEPGPEAEMAEAIPGIPEAEITTVVDVRDLVERKVAAFRAHLSQNPPDSVMQTMQGQILEAAFGTEHFVLARGGLGEGPPERSLFAGV